MKHKQEDDAEPGRRARNPSPQATRLQSSAQRWGRPTGGEVVENRGVVTDGRFPVEYYTSQPSPSQWIALGVVQDVPGSENIRSTHRMMVGNGDTEQAAIESLRQRVLKIMPPEERREPLPLLEFEPTAAQPSDWFGN